MSDREWKPGDVAVAFGEFVAFTDDREWFWAATGLACIDQPPHGLRPLALLDPEDREAVERLLRELHAQRLADPTGTVFGHTVDSMQAALREYANPTPPKCGAVLTLGDEFHRCDGAPNHDEPHHNDAVSALWGERA